MPGRILSFFEPCDIGPLFCQEFAKPFSIRTAGTDMENPGSSPAQCDRLVEALASRSAFVGVRGQGFARPDKVSDPVNMVNVDGAEIEDRIHDLRFAARRRLDWLHRWRTGPLEKNRKEGQSSFDFSGSITVHRAIRRPALREGLVLGCQRLHVCK